jgi:hypothetical protein
MLETPNKLDLPRKKPHNRYLGKDGTSELECTWRPTMRKDAIKRGWDPDNLTVRQYEILKSAYCIRHSISPQVFDTE